jgi:lipopolysaccharide heptosyltransferase II
MSESATLVVGPSWVGDMVLAQSLFKLMQEREPDVALDVLAPDWSLPVVARMPEVRQGLAAGTGHGEFGLATRRRIGRELRGRYERAIVLPRSFKSALIPWFARVPVRTGFRGEQRYGLINDMRHYDPDVLDQTIKRFLALGIGATDPLPLPPEPVLEVSSANQAAFVDAHGLDLDRPVIGLLPGAEFGPSKCWPVEHFAELALRLAADGYRVWLLGSPKDVASGNRIVDLAGDAVAITNLCGQTSLADAVDVLALTEQVVSNDSGLMHVAAAVGRHVHALYGATSPAFVAPLTHRRDIYFLDLDCSPCRQRVCPLGHHNCLRQILPAEVHARVLKRQVDRD